MSQSEEVAGAFEVVLDRRPEVLVIGLIGELDLSAAGAIAGLVAGFLRHPDRDVIFDLADLDFIDTSGACLFAAAVEVVACSGCRYSIVAASPPVARMIRFAGSTEVAERQASTSRSEAGAVAAASTVATKVPCAQDAQPLEPSAALRTLGS